LMNSFQEYTHHPRSLATALTCDDRGVDTLYSHFTSYNGHKRYVFPLEEWRLVTLK
jgi:hypothetical protein